MNSSRKKEVEATKENDFLTPVEEQKAPEPTKAPEAPVSSLKMSETPKKSLVFEQVITGDFEVIDFKEVGETILAQFKGVENLDGFTDESGNPKDMLIFTDYESRKKLVLNPSYSLEKLFVHKESENPILWEKNPIFQITFTGTDIIKGGKKVKNFDFKVAYDN